MGEKHFKCIDCHVEIRQRLEQQEGLHARLLGADRGDHTCVTCHSEHNGEDFALIHWDADVASFDHRKTGYWLDGRHAGLDCRKCHNAQHVSPQDKALIKIRDLNRTFLGLTSECRSCHGDEHRGQIEGDCRRCHGYKGWKEGLKFEHKMARYQLSGQHEKVPCTKCHPRVEDAKSYTKFTGLSFDNCTSCHADRHRGSFVNSCTACHDTANWKQVRLPPSFDHSRTRYTLEGRHASVPCATCHRDGNFSVALSFQQCTDCHKNDPHKGQFAGRPDQGQCSGCHSAAGFKPALFDQKSHANTRYPLQGKHLAVACNKCHVPAPGKETPFKFASLQCSACHADSHKGQFAGARHQNNCESCHTVAAFRPSRFTLTRHAQSRFSLDGGHAAVPCADCHRSPSGKYPQEPARFSFSDLSCAGCHADPHNRQFAERLQARRADGSAASCEACHNMKSWKNLAGFDHSTTAFRLEGAHAGLACERCHRSANFKSGIQNVVFRSAPRDCSGCHDDIHGGQFAAAKKDVNCSRCHTLKRWRPSLFDHEKDSSYQLAGAHRDVPCNLCHARIDEETGRSVRMYRATPKSCMACHGPERNAGKPPAGL